MAAPSGPRPPSLLAFLSLLAIGLVTLSLGIVNAAQNARVRQAQDWVSHTDAVLLTQAELGSALRDAERGQRGYLITGRTIYLDPYHHGRQAVQARLDRLLALSADNPAQHARIAHVATLVHAKLDELARSVALRDQRGAAAAAELVETDEGLRLMQGIGAAMETVTAEEQRLLATRLDAAHREQQRAARLGLAGTLVLVLLLSLSAWLVWLSQRTQAHQRERLAQLVGELETEGRRKDDFLATLAHELRNPLAPLRSSAELLARPELSPATTHRLALVIQRQVAHMKHLLDDLLTLTRLMHGKLMLDLRPACAQECIDSAIEMVQPTIDGRRQRLTVQAVPHDVQLVADAPRVTQVVANLLGNASKFSDDGAALQLHASVEAGALVVTVIDHGIGIAADQQARLFDRYYQVGVSAGRDRGGLGIGLALVRQIVEMHGGSISVRSAGVGLGTTATARLPLAGPPVPADR